MTSAADKALSAMKWTPCPFTPNPDQVDSDGDGVGDGQGRFAAPRRFAAGQSPQFVAAADLNRDGFSDLVVTNGKSDDVSVLLSRNADSDFDGIPDACDNCPFVFNPDQRDSNSDGVGDACAPTPTPTRPPTCDRRVEGAPEPLSRPCQGGRGNSRYRTQWLLQASHQAGARRTKRKEPKSFDLSSFV